MGSTLLSLHYHLIWSTKEREDLIDPAWEARLHAFLGGSFRSLGGVPLAIHGTTDHVHVLASLRATHCLADVRGDVKCVSSKWIRVESRRRSFHWQDGYAGFTIGVSRLPMVKGYIAKQKTHHARTSYADELANLLKKVDIFSRSDTDEQ